MQEPSNSYSIEAFLSPKAKIFVTPQYKTFIKPRNYKNKNSKLKEISVKFLTEDFEVNDVDGDKILAENEFLHLKETNHRISQIYDQIRNLRGTREILRQSSLLNRESKLKKKLLTSLTLSKNNFNQSEANFSKKFEKVLAKDGSKFIEQLFTKIKKIEVGIGVEFLGNLQQDITTEYHERVLALLNSETGCKVKVPDRVYYSFMLEDGFMLNFMENFNSQGNIEWYTKFFMLTAHKKTKVVTMTELKCDYEFRTEQRIQEVKYFAEGNILVIASLLPRENKNLIIQIFELTRNQNKVHLEKSHKIKTNGGWSQFIRAGGVEYIVYTNDLLSEEQSKKLNIMSFEDIFINSNAKPLIDKIETDIKIFKTCNLNNGFIIGEGPNNSIALIDLARNKILAYYKDQKEENNNIYLLASYSNTKNLLFLMHNSEKGAIISVYGVDRVNNILLKKQTFDFYTDLEAQSMQHFASSYFKFQFNHTQNRLDIVDDYQRALFRYKFDKQSKLIKDTEPIKLGFEIKDCLPSFLMTRIDGDLFFLQYFTLSTYLKSYFLKEN